MIDSRKILQTNEFASLDPNRAAQNLQNKDLIGKIFQNQDLFAGHRARFFLIKARKILIAGELCPADRNHAPQNIVKEGLTRKILRNKELAGDELQVPSAELMGLEASPCFRYPDNLAVQCARCDCARLWAVKVKVMRHNRQAFSCGKLSGLGG